MLLSTKSRFLAVLAATALSATTRVHSAEVVSNTATWAFSDLLSYRNATSKGWNFGNTAANAPATTLLGTTFYGNVGVNDSANGLTFTTAPLTYAIGFFVWTGASEQAARDALSRGGLHGGAGDFAMKFSAVAGHSYIVEVLALDAGAAGGRSMDIIVDNVTVVDDWYVPVGDPYNKLARIRVVADADGVDLRMGRGGIAGTEQTPAISAVTITEELAAPPSISTQPCSQSQPVGGSAVFSVIVGACPRRHSSGGGTARRSRGRRAARSRSAGSRRRTRGTTMWWSRTLSGA